jgi:HK97 family phage major capsid protein
MSTLATLRAALGKAADEADALLAKSAPMPKIRDKQAEIADLQERIAAAEKLQDAQRALARPSGAAGGTQSGEGKEAGPFKSLGEQLIAVARHFNGRGTDERLLQIKAPAGMGETDPSAGGFPVQVDFANTIMTRAYDMGEILKRVFRVPISGPSNGIKIPGIDETSRVTGSRWGGIQAYWVGEGDAATATKPKFRLIELDLKKLMAIWYVTDELLQDSTALTGIANVAFSEEMTFMIEDSVIHGTGAGQPQGILTSACGIVIPTEKGQATKTLLYQNLLNMWARMWARSRAQAVWYINQDVEPQLYALNQVIGTAGVPVYMPSGGLSGAPYSTLFGRPVIPIEYCETLGTQGDIILADFSQYVIADKNAMQQASSVHVRFLTDEMTFRLTYRCDGQPIWQAPLTPFRGTNTKSPFITLASR